MKVAQKYFDPVQGISSANNDMKYWNKAVDYYQEKKYKESLLNVLNYLDPNILKKNKDHQTIMIPHGSVVLRISIDDNNLEIIAPFVKMSETNPVPLLRQITEINFSYLVLSQILLRDDELYYYFKSPIDILEPYKIYDIFYEICIQADYYDDIFVDELGAKRIREPEVKELAPRHKKALWQRYQEYMKECDDYLTYFQTERSYAVGVDAALTTLMKIDYTINPQGKYRSDLEKLISQGLSKSDLSYAERFEQILSGLNSLKEYDEQKFLESLYIPNFFISVKTPIPLARVKETLSQDYNSAEKEIAHQRIISAHYFLLFGIYNLLYKFSPPRKIEEMLVQALKKASGKPWGTATDILLNTVKKIMVMR